MKYLLLIAVLALSGCHGVWGGVVLGIKQNHGIFPPMIFQNISTDWYSVEHGIASFHVNFWVTENLKQPAKYIDMVVVAYNAVDEPVAEPLAFRATGPYSGTRYQMLGREIAWIEPSIEYVCIDSLRIIYMDDTQEFFFGQQVDEMLYPHLEDPCAKEKRLFEGPEVESVLPAII